MRVRAPRTTLGRCSPLGQQAGFTLIEMLVSVAIMMVVMAGVFSVFNPSQGAFRTQPEVADLQQRLRLAVSEMTDGIRTAGAGSYRGAVTGPLSNVLAPIVPYRLGATSPDPRSSVFYRTDAMTVIRVPADAAESLTALPITSTSADIQVVTGAGCQPDVPACGFHVGDRVLLFNDGGTFDTFTVTGITGGNTLQHSSEQLSRTYAAGARLVEISMDTYYLQSPAGSTVSQLMHYDGFHSDEAIVDDVVALRFDYLGTPVAPALQADPAQPIGPWTTYGPKPPMLGVDNASDTWPASENCVFTLSSGRQVPRLSSLGTGSLVALTQAQLTDGPWCPDSSSPNRFDADLLRIRTIRVSVRLQTGVATLRGTNTGLFTRPGLGKDSDHLVPDQEIRFDISPRNVNLDR
jgi:prepilin-type N-terminal cleavage/methylation domain-containing protein